MSKKHLSHLDESGSAKMVDISSKSSTERVAIATSELRMTKETLDLIISGGMKKGDVIAVARVAGIMGAKRCSELIPLCHPLSLSSVEISIEPDYDLVGLRIESRVKVLGPTGVEMEALTAASLTALTLYDMAKSVQKDMEIGTTRLVSKTGGKSG